MESGKEFLMAVSRKRRRGSRFLGRRLVQSYFAARKVLPKFTIRFFPDGGPRI